MDAHAEDRRQVYGDVVIAEKTRQLFPTGGSVCEGLISEDTMTSLPVMKRSDKQRLHGAYELAATKRVTLAGDRMPSNLS
jgi:hypothetical protein